MIKKALICTLMIIPSLVLAKTPISSQQTLKVRQPNIDNNHPIKTPMKIKSSDFKSATMLNAQVANTFGCSGENKSPALVFENIPKNAKSLVLTAYDPDAPTGSGFWHWAVANIPVQTTSIQNNASGTDNMPKGSIELKNDAGFIGYIGACPPAGDKPHRYIFTLYALNDTLEVTQDTTPAVLGFMLNGKIITNAKTTVYYHR